MHFCTGLEQWWLCQASIIFSMLQMLPFPSIVKWKFDMRGRSGREERKKCRMFCFENISLWEWCLQNQQQKSFCLERNLGPSFNLDSTTDFTETDTDVNEGQLSLQVGVNQNCLKYADVRHLKLVQSQLWMCFTHKMCEFEYKMPRIFDIPFFSSPAIENNRNSQT